MSRTHLFEGQCLVNQGIDMAVRGLQRLKKAPELKKGAYAEVAAILEKHRAQVNLQFFSDIKESEEKDREHFERRTFREPMDGE